MWMISDYRVFRSVFLLFCVAHASVSFATDRGMSSGELFTKLPHHWMLVSEEKGKRVIRGDCDAGVETITLTREGELVELSHFLGQDSNIYTVVGGQDQSSGVAVYLKVKEKVHGATMILRKMTFLFENKERTFARVKFGETLRLFVRTDGFVDEYRVKSVRGVPVIVPSSRECDSYH